MAIASWQKFKVETQMSLIIWMQYVELILCPQYLKIQNLHPKTLKKNVMLVRIFSSPATVLSLSRNQ